MTRRQLTYGDGIGMGVAVIAFAVCVWISQAASELALIYKQLGPSSKLSFTTELVLSPVWRVGVPLALVAGIIAAHVWRPRYVMSVIALVTVGIDIFWYIAAYAPIFSVAGNIK